MMENGDLAKACNACKRAKRRCCKGTPTCGRCRDRGLECVYPPPRPSYILYGDAESWNLQQAWSHPDASRPLSVGPPPPAGRDSGPPPTEAPPTTTVDAGVRIAPLGVGTDLELFGHCTPPSSLPSPSPPLRVTLSDLQTAWFLTAETWDIRPMDPSDYLVPISGAVMRNTITRVRKWLGEWTVNGSNPFIHAQLYRVRQPRCIQDAFTALTSYMARTPATEDMVYRIMEERGAELVASKGMPPNSYPPSPESEPGRSGLGYGYEEDCLMHISRVHALIVYCAVRLFDSDVRQRHVAELQVPTLQAWTEEMLTASRRSAACGRLLLRSGIGGFDPGKSGVRTCEDVTRVLSPAQQESLLWHAWILAESVRRTWLVSHAVCSIYLTMRDGTADCAGGLMFTARRGVWDAASAFAWTKTCAERSVGFMHRNGLPRLLNEYQPGDVDEFSKVMMEIDLGTETLERWGLDIRIEG